MWGRMVRAYDVKSNLLTAFNVGIEGEHAAVSAVRALRPELDRCRLEGRQRLSPTATAYLDLLFGEVREEFGGRPLFLVRSVGAN